jgi:lipoprotein LprG
MDPAGGISSWLTAATGVTEGDQVREGDKVLTSYKGTVPGSAVADVIPSADSSATFPATFRIDDDGRLDSAEISGPFYGEDGDVDYALTLRDYGTEKDITAP